MEIGSSSAKIDKLNANNFHEWKQKIKHLLPLKDLDEFINYDVTAKAIPEWKRKDVKAQAIIGPTLSPTKCSKI